MKSVTSLIAFILILLPGLASAQGDTDAIRQFRRTVFKLQQEILELQDDVDRQKRELQAQKEYLDSQVERLTEENSKFKKHLMEMDSLLFQFEDQLASSALTKLSAELKNLRDFNRALLLDSMEHSEESEKILLDIINQPETRIPKDLLILILAHQKRNQGLLEESLSYYSTLLAEFSGSPFFTQGIYEMAEVLEKLGKTDQQTTLLTQLSAFSETDKYSIAARNKLRESGSETVLEDEETDSTADTSREDQPLLSPQTADPDDATTDESPADLTAVPTPETEKNGTISPAMDTTSDQPEQQDQPALSTPEAASTQDSLFPEDVSETPLPQSEPVQALDSNDNEMSPKEDVGAETQQDDKDEDTSAEQPLENPQPLPAPSDMPGTGQKTDPEEQPVAAPGVVQEIGQQEEANMSADTETDKSEIESETLPVADPVAEEIMAEDSDKPMSEGSKPSAGAVE